MANEDIQEKMDFIIEQQARFSADIGELKDTVKDLTGAVSQMAYVLNDTQDLVKRLVVVTHTLALRRRKHQSMSWPRLRRARINGSRRLTPG